jgi:hypothetical protein
VRDVSPALRFSLGKLQPSDRTGWLAAIRCLDVGSLTANPCRHAAGRTTFKG